MRKNMILIPGLSGLALVAIIFVLAWLGSRGSTSKSKDLEARRTPVLSAKETHFDFGSVSMAAGKVKHEFKIQNPGGQPVKIKKIYTSCMCTEANLVMGNRKFGPYGMPGHGRIPLVNQTISPEYEAIIEAIFDPAAHGPAGIGQIERSITIEEESGATLELGFKVLVTP